jgi:hypothetical protein
MIGERSKTENGIIAHAAAIPGNYQSTSAAPSFPDEAFAANHANRREMKTCGKNHHESAKGSG